MLVFLEGSSSAKLTEIGKSLQRYAISNRMESYLLDGTMVPPQCFSAVTDMAMKTMRESRYITLMRKHEGAVVIVTNASVDLVLTRWHDIENYEPVLKELYKDINYPFPTHVISIKAQKGGIPVFTKRDLLLANVKEAHNKACGWDGETCQWHDFDMINSGLKITSVNTVVSKIKRALSI